MKYTKKSFLTWVGAILFIGLFGLISPAQSGECPASNSVTKLSGSSGFQKQGPYDLKTMTHATATQTDKGLVVFLSNAPIDAKKAAPKLPLPPVTGKGKVAFILSFENKGKVVAGSYQPTSFTDPQFVRSTLTFGFAGGGMMDSTTLNQGTAQITKLSDTKVCGTFNLQGQSGAAAGQFSAPIVK